jgi:2-methylcitrate dehydratase PrpD
VRADPLRELARFSSRTSLASLPASVVEKARALLLYGVGVGMASAGAPGLTRTVAALRIGRDHARDLSERGFRTTPIYGAIGAAAACAGLLALDAERAMNALSLTTHATAGLRQFADAGTDEYPYQAGLAARSGVTSALLAVAQTLAPLLAAAKSAL